jgi:hypothetical protein
LIVWVYSGSSSYTMDKLKAEATAVVQQVLTANRPSFQEDQRTKTFSATNGIQVGMCCDSHAC